jgi:uncharacterized membrane protein YphA (DoxX/SURF4 family)
MKAIKITYWITTAIISLMMLFSAYSYFTQPAVAEGFKHLGFPDYFRIELGVAKLAAAIALILPFFPRVKEWAYAGLTITFISASIAHTASGDSTAMVVSPLVMLAILAGSYFTFHKTQQAAV